MTTKRKKATNRKPRTLVMPGELVCGPSIIIAPLSPEEGGSLRGHIKYTLTTRRHDDEWQIDLEWIDRDLKGQIVKLPTAVTQAIYRQRDQIIDKSLKARGKKAHDTRVMNLRATEQPEPGNEAEEGEHSKR